MQIDVALTKCRPATPLLIVLLLVALAGISILSNLWLMPSGLWKPVYQHTGGLVHPTLLVAPFIFGILVVVIIMLVGKYRPGEIGLQVSKLPSALFWVAIVWMTMQATAAIVSLITDGAISIDEAWTNRGAGPIFGEALGQFFGTALNEEIVFRGFLFAQCIAFMTRLNAKLTRIRLIGAVLLCAMLFAVPHIPNRLMKEQYVNFSAVAGDLAMLLVMGCFFCWLYLRTSNLFFLIGVHSLMNYPTMLMAMPGDSELAKGLTLILTVILALLWKHLPGIHRTNKHPNTSE